MDAAGLLFGFKNFRRFCPLITLIGANGNQTRVTTESSSSGRCEMHLGEAGRVPATESGDEEVIKWIHWIEENLDISHC